MKFASISCKGVKFLIRTLIGFMEHGVASFDETWLQLSKRRDVCRVESVTLFNQWFSQKYSLILNGNYSKTSNLSEISRLFKYDYTSLKV